jgi:hypothetical protein
MKSPNWPCPALLCVLLVVPFLIPTPGLSEGTNQELPAAELTGGVLGGDGISEGYGDIVAPVVMLQSGLVFVNPRASYTDNSSEEYNLGVGYRHLLAPKHLILGANVYYDYRETSLGSRFNQLGFGLEILGDWVDARANYYLPDDDRETVNEYDTESVSHSSSSRGSGWGAPYATGNEIVQDSLTVRTFTTTTTRQHFEQFEQAMEGWDCELGVRLPIPVVMDYADVKVFGGYYFYNASFSSDDIEGFKGRIEIKALPAVFLDAEFYENKDLAGSDFFVGARMRVPFDVANISKGRNPFAGTVAGFTPSGKRVPFASRLTEMVMRDLHVRTEVSEVMEDVSRREETSVSQTVTEASRYTLVTNANFVDGDNRSGVENGTAEHPYNTISEGASNAVGDGVIYVYDAAASYTENVFLRDGQTIWGSGCLIQGQVGMAFGSGIFPVVDGRSRGPTFTLANNTTLRGLEIINTEDLTQPARPFYRPEWGTVETRRVGVFADDVTPVTLEYNRVNSVQYGALLGKDGSFDVTLADNDFSDAEDGGVRIGGFGSSGTFSVDAQRNTFSKNGGSGLEIMAGNYDLANISLLDNTASGNDVDGVWLHIDNNGPVDVTVDGLVASGNGDDGLKIQAYSVADSAPVTVTLRNSELRDNDFCGVEVYSATSGNLSTNRVSLSQISALRNFDDGVYVEAQTSGDDSPVEIGLVGVDANNQVSDYGVEVFATVEGSGSADVDFDWVNAISNGNGGIYADVQVTGSDGDAALEIFDVAANDNGSDGFYVNAQNEHGGAYVMFTGSIEANDNGGSGIRVEAVEAHVATDGMALASFEYVEANNNAGAGIWVGSVLNDGDAEFSVFGTSASGNGGAGIQVDHLVGAGLDATTRGLIWWVTANNNAGDGICLSEVHGQAGPVTVLGLDVAASGNAGNGICLPHVETYGQDSTASVTLKNATTDVNGVHGIYSYVVSHEGSAEANFSDIHANGNGSNGVCLAFVNAQGDGASASASFANVESSANSNRGIYAYVLSDDGAALANFTNVTANGNRRDGIYLDYVESDGNGGDATANFTDVDASGNGGDGVAAWSDAYGANSDAAMTFLRTTVHNNGGCGIYTEVYAENGDAYLTGERVVAFSNRQDGVQIYTYGASDVFADFGNGAQGSAGQCSIYSNTLFNMNNTGSDPVVAQSNWWGSATPAPGKFSGSIDHANPLAVDPNP